MKNIVVSLKLMLTTLFVCSVVYPLALFIFARLITPETAEGSFIRNQQGNIIGSRLIGQSFSSPGYFWGRPSAVSYDAAGAGGSNLSPTSPKLGEQALQLITKFEAHTKRPIPADLVTASGGGLDPHISLQAALYQVPRIASARSVSPEILTSIINRLAFSAGGKFAPEKIVHVLDLNLMLDQIKLNP